MKYLLWQQVRQFCFLPLEAFLRKEIGGRFEVKQLQKER